MKNKKFLEENLGRIYMYNGSFVEVVGYLDDYPGVINIVRYLNPDNVRGRAECWGTLLERDMVEKGYYAPGSVYSYVLPRYLRPVSYTVAVQEFAEAYRGEKFSIRYGWIVTVVGYSTDCAAVIVARTQGGWQRLGRTDIILFNSEEKTFNYVDYRELKPIMI